MGLLDSVHPQWVQALAPVAEEIKTMADFLAQETAHGRTFLPELPQVFHAFTYPLDEVKVLIVGQDPYPTPGHAMGLSFSVQPQVQPLPRSLANIFTELHSDLGITRPQTGDLRPWSAQGVMLLNRCLTVESGRAGSHRGKGWETITDAAISALMARGTPLVAVLWGREAQTLSPLLGATPILASAHPSPLSARRGFFGSRPFSRANALLQQQGADPIDWSVLSGPSGALF